MVSRLRVLVRDMPPLLGDIVAGAIAGQSDMELMTEGPSPPVRDREGDPDVIIVSTPDIEQYQNATTWLDRVPRARVLAIETGGRRSVVYELRPHATVLGELSPTQLVDVIRFGHVDTRFGRESNTPRHG